jgi:DNA-binding LacI/PurR family transcriptional regulator
MSANDPAPDSSDRRRPAVMSDVARLAGVSHQTVSRVINGGIVATATRDRVLEAIRMLDYRPNSAARALVTGKTRTIGVISFDTTLHGPASTLLAIEQAAHSDEYFTSIASLRAIDPTSVRDAVHRLRLQGIEGILLIAPQVSAISAMLGLAADIPIVAVEAGPPHGFPVVAVDQEAGAVAATRHLLDAGHATVFHVAGPVDWEEANQRVSGWRSALLAAGAPVPDPLRGDWSARAGYELAAQLLSRRDVTAVFAANDQMALGLLRASHEAGLSIPQDLSIVGFDDITEAQYFTPPLTTVRQPFAEMGRQAFELLLREIAAGRRSEQRVVIGPELVVRASSGPPKP